MSSTGEVSGKYSDTDLQLNLRGFYFSGNKSGSNYNGTAVLIYYFSPNPDTLTINNAVLVKQ